MSSMNLHLPQYLKPNRSYFRLWRSEVDWCYRSSPQPQLLPPGRRIDLERGKTLGGSSSINYGMWVRGAPQDFDRWSREFGCGEKWSYKSVCHNFERVERILLGEAQRVGCAGERYYSSILSLYFYWFCCPLRLRIYCSLLTTMQRSPARTRRSAARSLPCQKLLPTCARARERALRRPAITMGRANMASVQHSFPLRMRDSALTLSTRE